MKKILQIVVLLFIGGLSLLSCQNEGKVANSELKKEGGLSAFLNNTDMWNYLYENQFISDIDSSVFTFKNFRAYKNGKQVTEDLQVDDMTISSASLSGISLSGSKAYLIVVKDGVRDGIIDMSDPNKIEQYKVRIESEK